MDRDFVEKINTLVKKSFGRFHRSNYRIPGGFDGSLIRADDLEVIATKLTFFGDPQFGCGIKGLLGAPGMKSDGSVIVVIKKYQKKAETYACLYEKEFGQRVLVLLVNSFEELFPKVGLLSHSPYAEKYPFATRS